MQLTRREFMKVGVASALALALVQSLKVRASAGVSGSTLVSDRTLVHGSLDLKALNNTDAACLAALAPVILEGALPEEAAAKQIAINEVVEAFDRTIMGLPPAVQAEVRELLSLLTFSLTRRFVAGVKPAWPDAREAEIKAFLTSWRDSRFQLLQQGYQALVRVMIACWYGNPLAWGKIGYRGPPFAKELGLE